MSRKKVLPKIIQEVGFDFQWSTKKVWELNIQPEDMDISELEWHFEIPFWSKPNGFYDLKPQEVLENPEKYKKEHQRIINADMTYPLDIMSWKNRWLLLDGLHRLVKAKSLRLTTVKVRKIPASVIPLISK
jgi:hypothetical protein